MTTKEIIPCLELRSNEFEKKVLFSLEKVGNVRIIPQILYNDENREISKFVFALMNTQSSKKSIVLLVVGITDILLKNPLLKKKKMKKDCVILAEFFYKI